MTRPFRRLAAVVAVTATVLAGATATADAGGNRPKHESTRFAFAASGFGTQVRGGAIPANSDETAFNIIACTNKTGIMRNNFEANVNIPGLGTAHGVRTDLWTSRKGGTYNSYSTHSIARLNLGSAKQGSVEILGLQSLSRAYHQSGAFKAQTHTSIASITFTPPGGKAQVLDIPTPNKPITIPGLATIAIGTSIKTVTKQGAAAAANVLTIKVIPTKTRVIVAQTHANIGSGIKSGVFKGYSSGLRVSALADNAQVGRTPLTPLPCEGTKGKPIVKSIASVTLGNSLVAQAVSSGVLASQTKTVATGVVRGQVGKTSLGNGQIQVQAVVGQVKAIRKNGRVTTSDKGTQVLGLVINGKAYQLKKLQTITIPGVAKIESDVHKKLKNGLRVIGLQVTLFDGTGAVVDLGIAQIQIKKGVTS